MINFVAFVLKHELENTNYVEPWMSILNCEANPEGYKKAFSVFEGWEDVQAMIEVSFSFLSSHIPKKNPTLQSARRPPPRPGVGSGRTKDYNGKLWVRRSGPARVSG